MSSDVINYVTGVRSSCCLLSFGTFCDDEMCFSRNGDTFTLEVPVVIRLTCDCAVADDAVMPIHAESSS